jgi:hypothetical protein
VIRKSKKEGIILVRLKNTRERIARKKILISTAQRLGRGQEPSILRPGRRRCWWRATARRGWPANRSSGCCSSPSLPLGPFFLDLLPLGLGEDRANVSLGAVVNDFWSRGGTVFENSAVGENRTESVGY